jgi:hypothetical protein
MWRAGLARPLLPTSSAWPLLLALPSVKLPMLIMDTPLTKV